MMCREGIVDGGGKDAESVVEEEDGKNAENC